MKPLTLIFIFILSLSGIYAQTTSGGPDKFGYTFRTSTDSLGPTYSWFDISNIGARIYGLGDDNYSTIQPISGFHYYGAEPNALYIGSNGYIAFNPTNIASSQGQFPAIPSTASPNGFIAPLLCDLTFSGLNNRGFVYYYDKRDTICITFLKVPFWQNDTLGYSGDNTFQVILNRKDSSITFNYKVQSGRPSTSYTVNALSIGIENASGSDGLQYYRGNNFPTAAFSIKYYSPKNPQKITDLMLNWIENDENGGFFVEKGDTISPEINIKNVGGKSVEAGFSVTYNIQDSSGTSLTAGSLAIDSLGIGKDSTKKIPKFVVPSPGRYSINASISGVPYDSISSNDRLGVFFVAIDSSRYFQSLNYSIKQYPSGGISWLGGNAGVGIYINELPFYPARIDAVHFYILNLGAANGFHWELYDDQSRYKTPNNIIDSSSVNIMQLRPYSFYTDTLKNKNLIVNKGGVYLSWIMDGSGIVLGTSSPLFTPASRRTFEVISGIWSPFRDRQTEEFMMYFDVSDPTITTLTEAQFQKNEFKIYPNPANDFINVDFDKNSIDWKKARLFDINGRYLQPKIMDTAAGIKIYKGNLKNGTYLLQIGNQYAKLFFTN